MTEPGSKITVIDSSLKGSSQEGLAALFPDIEWQGLYLFHKQSPHDPHPGSKTGYALHIDATEAGEEPTVEELPAGGAKFFAHPTVILAIEDLLHGPFPSPTPDLDSTEPEVPPVDEINPLDISPAFQDPATRIAASAAMLLAVRDYAHDVARHRESGGDWRGELDEKAEESVDELRAWISGDTTDPAFAEVLGSFVRPVDRHVIADLRAAIDGSDLNTGEIDAVWRGYRQAGSLLDKRTYADHIIETMTQR